MITNETHVETVRPNRVGRDDAIRVGRGLAGATLRVVVIAAAWASLMALVGVVIWLYEQDPAGAVAFLGVATIGVASSVAYVRRVVLHRPRRVEHARLYRLVIVLAAVIAIWGLLGLYTEPIEPPIVEEDGQSQEVEGEPPIVVEVQTPSWLAIFRPLALLPLWGQAAVLSASVAGTFFIVPMILRWVWSLGPEVEDDSGPRNRT